MRKMTIERSEQLKKELLEMQQNFKKLKSDVNSVKAGLWDDRLQAEWETIETEQKTETEKFVKTEVKVEIDQDDTKPSGSNEVAVAANIGEVDESTQDSIDESVDIYNMLTDEECNQSSNSGFLTSTPIAPSNISSADFTSTKLPAPSHLLSSLLKSDVKTATELQQLKIEQEQEQQQQQQLQTNQSVLVSASRTLLKTPVTQDDPLTSPPSSSKCQDQTTSTLKMTSTLKTTSSTPLKSATSVSSATNAASQEVVEEESVEDRESQPKEDDTHYGTAPCTDVETDNIIPDGETSFTVEEVVEEVIHEEVLIKKEEELEATVDDMKDGQTELDVVNMDNIKEETDKDSQDEDDEVSLKPFSETVASETDLNESLVKDEPLSPTSSISSKISETGSKRGNRSRGRPRGVRSSRISMRKSCNEEERKDDVLSKLSDAELSEDEVRENDDLLTGALASGTASSLFSESFPNSPASLSMCSDTEEEKSFKQWKKSIMLVWRAAATHKYANVFLHPVTDEIAPGYQSVVLRPMDLSTIKKNVETGLLRTTVEFQRDMMLMFTNAIMYNSSDHNVFKMAKEMYDDVMQHIEQYVNTQIMVQTTDSKNLRQSRRPDGSEKEEDVKKRRLSVDQVEGGKVKKRKTRLDESFS